MVIFFFKKTKKVTNLLRTKVKYNNL